MNILLEKLKEVSLSVLPITLLVIILNFTMVPIDNGMLARFIIGAILVIIGLGIFLFGAHIGIGPIGNLMGETIAKTNKSYIVGILGFILGFLITIAEPDLQILADQVNLASGGIVPSSLILIVVSIGVGIMVGIGLLRILYGKPLNKIFTLVYIIIFILGLSVSEEFLAISVDASGATTGAMTTPFILALGYGVSQLKGGKTSEEDSFGMVGLASAGPIFAIMIMSIVSGITNIQGETEAFISNVGILTPYLNIFPQLLKESVVTLLPLSMGIALAVTMSMLRIMIPSLKLWHFLLPGFAIAAFLSYKVPPIFVGIAYDSGGVASGPMTATFVLAFAQGASSIIPTANVMVDGFGVIAMVAMMPLVAIQVLGLIFKIKAKKEV